MTYVVEEWNNSQCPRYVKTTSIHTLLLIYSLEDIAFGLHCTGVVHHRYMYMLCKFVMTRKVTELVPQLYK